MEVTKSNAPAAAWARLSAQGSSRLLSNSRPPVISMYTLWTVSGSLRMNLFKGSGEKRAEYYYGILAASILACSMLSDKGMKHWKACGATQSRSLEQATFCLSSVTPSRKSVFIKNTYFSSLWFINTVKPVLSGHRVKRTPLLSGRGHLKCTWNSHFFCYQPVLNGVHL